MKRALAFFVVIATVITSQASLAADRPPNIVLIMADDFGYECVTANGGTSYRTPNLDKLAATGMRFEQCHVQPLCTPTRVQLMTGLYNVRNYVRFGHLDPEATTFAHLLKRAGYATAIAGKWQLGQDKDLPQRLGFDESFLWQHTRRPPRYANPSLERNGVELNYENGEYGPALVNDFALDFVSRHQDRPFLLYYPMMLTHGPFQPTPDSPDWNPRARGENSNRDVKHFADMTAYMDGLIGRLVAKLDELKLRDDTLLIFLGDNGTGKGVVSQYQGQPYQGGKGSSTARGTHVPLIVNWPGQVPGGRVNSDLIDSTDFLPTLCEVAGAKLPEAIDGQSFARQLRSEAAAPRQWSYFWYAPQGGATPQFEFAMTTRHKLYRDGTFFALDSDPFEQSPLRLAELSAENAGAAKSLQAALDKFTDARPKHLSTPDKPKRAKRRAGK